MVRGKVQGEKTGGIEEILIRRQHGQVVLDRLLAEDSNDRIIELLKGRRMYPVLAQESPGGEGEWLLLPHGEQVYKTLYGVGAMQRQP